MVNSNWLMVQEESLVAWFLPKSSPENKKQNLPMGGHHWHHGVDSI
jgi:hypothetical protein